MDTRNRIFEEPDFIRKEEYTEQECLRYFAMLEEGLYHIPAIGWFVRIEDSGAFLIDIKDQASLKEVQRESAAFRTIKELPDDVMRLFGKSVVSQFQLAFDVIQQRILDLLKRNSSSLKGFHPERN